MEFIILAGIALVVILLVYFNLFSKKVKENSSDNVIIKGYQPKYESDFKNPPTGGSNVMPPKPVHENGNCLEFMSDYPAIYDCIKKILDKYEVPSCCDALDQLAEWHVSQMNLCSESFTIKKIIVPSNEMDKKTIKKAKEDLSFYDCFPVTYHELELSGQLINALASRIDKIRYYHCRVLSEKESDEKEAYTMMDKLKGYFNKERRKSDG